MTPPESSDPNSLQTPAAIRRRYTPIRADRSRDPCSHSNALLQFLFAFDPIRRYIIENPSSGKMHYDLGKTFAEMFTESEKDHTAQGITTWSKSNTQLTEQLLSEPTFQAGKFSDAHFDLMHLLDTIIKEANKAPQASSPFEFKSPREAWNCYRKLTNDTVLANLLTIMMEAKFDYIDCDHQCQEIDFSNYLPLDMSNDIHRPLLASKGQISCTANKYLDEMFALYSSTDVCGECHVSSQFTRKVNVLREPPYLMIQLKRFTENEDKITRPVVIDESMTLVNRNYHLFSAVLHKGTAIAGHYLTLVREAANQWVILDDQSIVKLVGDTLAKELLKRWAYLVLYKAADLKHLNDNEFYEICQLSYVGIIESPLVEADRKDVENNEIDEKLRDLDQQIASLRNEIETEYADYDVNTALSQRTKHTLNLPPKHPYCGLFNDRFICYSNSVIQALYTCPRIRLYILESGNQGHFHKLMADLFAGMIKESTAGPPSPIYNAEKEFNVAFREKRKEFTRGEMHDSQEYLTILIELVHEEANNAAKNRKNRPSEVPDFKNAIEAWQYHLTYVDDSSLSKLLMGQMETSLACLSCGNRSLSWSAIWQLQLELNHKNDDQTLTLMQCIDQFAAPETLDATCHNCKSQQKFTKQQTLCRVPHYLIIHLKRFTHTGQKIHRQVEIDQLLILVNTPFALSNAICHRGSEDIGHYYTLLRERNNVWVQLDDEAIYRGLSQRSADNMLRSFAYVCIYKAIEEI